MIGGRVKPDAAALTEQAHQRFDFGLDKQRAKGFADEVVGTVLQAFYLQIGIRRGRQNVNWDCLEERAVFDEADKLHAVDVGHAQISQDDIGEIALLKPIDRFDGVTEYRYPKIGVHHMPDDLPDVIVIIDI
jgi:hypothetical protein